MYSMRVARAAVIRDWMTIPQKHETTPGDWSTRTRLSRCRMWEVRYRGSGVGVLVVSDKTLGQDT